MATIKEEIKDLAYSQKLLTLFTQRLENHPIYSQDEYQEFIGDLRDYLNGLSLVTYLENTDAEQFDGVYHLDAILKEQAGLLSQITNDLNGEEGKLAAIEAYGMTDGEVRRAAASLSGLIEFNRELQKEESMQVDFADSVTAIGNQEMPKKKGFFGKLFGK